MNKDNQIVLFLVDDDALFLKSLEIEFLNYPKFAVQTFATGELCLASLADKSNKPEIIILDYNLDGIEKNAMNGMETLDKIKAKYDKMPVIMLSSQDKIEIAVDCMHHKAADYIVKSETAFIRLQASMENIFKYQRVHKELSWYMDRM
ncbi:MAG: Chemotaxis response regulator protein-glutamate methylesterase [Bacteroidota bacterium]|jgi:DNA-binding NtrC family response regulator